MRDGNFVQDATLNRMDPRMRFITDVHTKSHMFAVPTKLFSENQTIAFELKVCV